MSLPDTVLETCDWLLEQGIPEEPEATIILGSGLGSFTSHIRNATAFSYNDIPHLPSSSVEGHAGELISGSVNDYPVIAFSGRFHHYEGFSFDQTVIPVRLAKALGSRKLLISNAAGGINTSFSVGDLMVIEDVMRQNLAISPKGNEPYRYTHYQWVDTVREIGAELGLALQRGTYIYAKGPNYESKAEIRAFRRMGADAVGMSTAPEMMEASRLRIKTAAVSLISNMAAGVTPGKLSHEEVSEAADSRKKDFARLFTRLIEKL